MTSLQHRGDNYRQKSYFPSSADPESIKGEKCLLDCILNNYNFLKTVFYINFFISKCTKSVMSCVNMDDLRRCVFCKNKLKLFYIFQNKNHFYLFHFSS